MTPNLTDLFKSQLDQTIQLFEGYQNRASSDTPDAKGIQCITSARGVIDRIVGMNSQYGQQALTIINEGGFEQYDLPDISGQLIKPHSFSRSLLD